MSADFGVESVEKPARFEGGGTKVALNWLGGDWFRWGRVGFMALGCVLAGLGLRFENLTQCLVSGRLYFVDADCYSRMTRARMVSEAPGRVIHHQTFENWPEGVWSHATAPMDYLIVGLERVVRWGWPRSGRFSELGRESLDVAGALVSPLLGLGLVAFVFLWAAGLRRADGRRLSGWWMAPVLAAVGPALVHATRFGRPDHQSLLVVLLGVALGSEQRMGMALSRGWAVVGGLAWGGALWVSLFEPVVLLGATCVLGCALGGRAWMNRKRAWWALSLGGMVGGAYAVEGLPAILPALEWTEVLMRWGGTIGELRRLEHPAELGRWLGGLVWATPLLGLVGWREKGAARVWLGLMLGLILLSVALTWWQIRWGPYLTLVFVFGSPWILEAFRRGARGEWVVTGVGLLALWPVVAGWEEKWNPESSVLVERHMDRSERINARLAAERMRSPEVQPFLAPWWLSPAMAYWSGQPAVAGSGHEGIAGILDSARFFLATDWSEAREILDRRGVRMVVAGDQARSAVNSAEILGRPIPPKPLCERLWDALPPKSLRLDGELNVTTFRLLRVLPREGAADGARGAGE